MIRHHLTSLITVMLTALAAAQTSRPADTAAATEVRAAAKSFVDALLGDDLLAMGKLFDGSDENRYMLENFWSKEQSHRKFERAVAKRWPTEKRKPSEVPGILRQAIAEAPVSIDRNEAAIGDQMRLSHGKDGWRVVDFGTEADKSMADLFADFSTAYDAVAAEIEAGKFTIAAEADAAVQQSLAKLTVQRKLRSR